MRYFLAAATLLFLFWVPCPAPACSLCGSGVPRHAFVGEYWQAHAAVYGALANPKLTGNSGQGTTELHVEKVIDLNDKQSTLFGLIDANDAMLLVASGDVTLGVDLSKLGDGDVSMDPTTHIAKLRLPPPQR